MTTGSALVITLMDGTVHRINQNCTTTSGWRWYQVYDDNGDQIAAFRTKDIRSVWIES